MARIRRPGESAPVAPPGNAANRNRDRNRNRNRNKTRTKGSGLSEDTGAGAASTTGTTPGTTTAFAVQDPAAYMRHAMGQAGFGHATGAYGDFLNDTIVNTFAQGWDEWKAANPVTSDQDFFNYAKNTGMGLPDAYTGGPGGNAFAPGAPPEAGPGTATNAAGAVLALPFDQWVKQTTGTNVRNMNPGRIQRLRQQFDDYVMQLRQQPALANAPASDPNNTNLTAPAAPPVLSPEDWSAANAFIQNEIDKYTPMQQGRYDTGKRPGSIRYNLFA